MQKQKCIVQITFTFPVHKLLIAGSFGRYKMLRFYEIMYCKPKFFAATFFRDLLSTN